MNKFNRILSLLLAAVLVLGMIPAPALAAPAQQDAWQVVQVNPHYAHLFTEEEILALLPARTPGTVRPQATTYLDLESGALALCEGMKNRQATIEVNWSSTTEDYSAACYEIMDLAMAHTGDPKGGDAIQWAYGGWRVEEMYRISGDGVYNFTAVFRVYYYTTAEQEQELDKAVEELLAQLNLDGKTDYEKIYAVYDYICSNITYDHEHLYDDDYFLMYTAYAALINKTAVCQGYAVLLYRLLLELGIDCRVITGWGGGPHAWNIVELDGLYYNADSTWDAGYPSYYRYYFLNSMWDFLDHMRDEECNTVAFHNEYPMAAQSYQQGAKAEMDPYIDAGYLNDWGTAFWRVRRSGEVMEIFGTGDCWDYPEEENQVPWYYAWFETITDLRVDEGITRLGSYAFRDAAALETVKLPTTLESLGTNCFQRCENLSTISFTGDAPAIASNAFTGVTATAYYPGDNATWTADKLQNYGGTLTWKIEGATHSHSYTPAVTAPTCTAQGYTTYTCECGEGYIADYVPALGHAWDEGVVTKEPTEETYGEMRYTCTACGETRTEQIPPVVHSHNYTAVVTAPTCTNSGFTTYTCACGDSYTAEYVPALGHALGEWYTVTDPTCTAEGSERRDCARCDNHESRTIPNLGHSYTAVVTAPTCTEQGFTTYTCACGDSYVADHTEALGHSWDEGVVTREPAEGEYGERLHTCTRCGETKTEKLPPLDHTHSHEALVTAPTCTEQGFTTYTCECGDSYVADYTDALGHDLGEWTTITAPTCTAEGTERRDCSRCDYAEVRSTEIIPHSHEALVTAPTCTEQGFTTYTCECGDSYISDYTDALGHDYADGICTRCGAVNNPFTDVPDDPGCFYRDPVLWAVENGITTGASADTFNPNGQCQRAQVVTFLWRAAGQPEPTSTVNPFEDVKETDFYYKAVLWAVEKGITNGVDATHFGPFAYCNRAQVVTFLYRAMGDLQNGTSDCPFTDVAPGAWYEAPILWAVENGITNGMGDGTFGVNTVCNRAQVVTFLYRTYVN